MICLNQGIHSISVFALGVSQVSRSKHSHMYATALLMPLSLTIPASTSDSLKQPKRCAYTNTLLGLYLL